MPMERVFKRDAISKAELHQRLREWIATDEAIIGPPGQDERTAWVYVKDGDAVFKLHADTKKVAVEEYLRLVGELGENLVWNVVPNKLGNLNAVAYGESSVQLTNTLYLYLVD